MGNAKTKKKLDLETAKHRLPARKQTEKEKNAAATAMISRRNSNEVDHHNLSAHRSAGGDASAKKTKVYLRKSGDHAAKDAIRLSASKKRESIDSDGKPDVDHETPKFTTIDKYMSLEEKALHHYQAMVVLNPKDAKSYIKLGDAMCLQE